MAQPVGVPPGDGAGGFPRNAGGDPYFPLGSGREGAAEFARAMAFMASSGVNSFVVVMSLTCPPAATAMLQAVAASTLGNSMTAMKSYLPRLM